jgi:hypothetical protein
LAELSLTISAFAVTLDTALIAAAPTLMTSALAVTLDARDADTAPSIAPVTPKTPVPNVSTPYPDL